MNRKNNPLEITPDEFESQVYSWLQAAAKGLTKLSIHRLKHLNGDSGDYEIDVLAELEILGGAQVRILVECKRYSHPVKRDVLMVLESKIRDSNAHKGIVFSTLGFQSGAIAYAKKRGIATIEVKDGKSNWITASADDQPVIPPPWVKVSKFIGWVLAINDKGHVTGSLLDDDHTVTLEEWFAIASSEQQSDSPKE